jgi:hypothetical protein
VDGGGGVVVVLWTAAVGVGYTIGLILFSLKLMCSEKWFKKAFSPHPRWWIETKQPSIPIK